MSIPIHKTVADPNRFLHHRGTSMSKSNVKTVRLSVVQLENREIPSIGSAQMVGSVLTVRTDNSPSTVIVNESNGNIQITDAVTGKSQSFAASNVGRVDVYGGTGNDVFTVRNSVGVRVRMYGQGGDDTMYGGTTRDIMVGGNGNDKLYGRGGNDYLDGGNGDDGIDGGAGSDILAGDAGVDQLNGGAGIDAISGGDGNDTLISIDGGETDSVDGGAGSDIFWIDKSGGTTDGMTGLDGLDTTNAVSGFTNTGADVTLNGDKISDPLPLPGDVLENFSGRPLFASQGPTYQDITQGQLGDCWLLAGLGAVANIDPAEIRSHVVDFGDGTYGVRLGNNFYRVDSDLPVANVGGVFLQYTAPGVDNSLWVAIMEKAYAYYRTGANTYDSIQGGNSYDVFPAFGLTPDRVFLDSSLSQDQMSAVIKQMVDTGSAPTIGIYTPGTGVPFVDSHQYILLGYNTDPNTGLVDSVTVRNPWGVDGPGTAPGPGNDNNFDDGILTITLDQLATCDGTFEWGTF